MAFCTNCGAPLPDDAQFCTACGAPVAPAAQQAQPDPQPPFQQSYAEPNGEASEFDPQDVQQNKVMAVLAYFGILVLVPLLAAKDSKFARFHTNQGIVLLIVEVVFSAVLRVVRNILTAVSIHLGSIASILSLGYILLFILAILGIVNAANGKAKELPVIGSFKLLK